MKTAHVKGKKWNSEMKRLALFFALFLFACGEADSQGIFDPGSPAMVVLSSQTTGTLSTPQGGTGRAGVSNKATLVGAGASLPMVEVIGTANQVFRVPSDGSAPIFGAIDLAAGASVSGVLPNANTTATSANTASTIVSRDGSGNFSTGGISIGGGATVTKIITATDTLDFPLSALTGCDDLTMTLTGAVDGDTIMLGVTNGSVPAESSFFAWVSAADTVTVRHCSHNLAADPGSGTFRATIMRF